MTKRPTGTQNCSPLIIIPLVRVRHVVSKILSWAVGTKEGTEEWDGWSSSECLGSTWVSWGLASGRVKSKRGGGFLDGRVPEKFLLYSDGLRYHGNDCFTT